MSKCINVSNALSKSWQYIHNINHCLEYKAFEYMYVHLVVLTDIHNELCIITWNLKGFSYKRKRWNL